MIEILIGVTLFIAVIVVFYVVVTALDTLGSLVYGHSDTSGNIIAGIITVIMIIFLLYICYSIGSEFITAYNNSRS